MRIVRKWTLTLATVLAASGAFAQPTSPRDTARRLAMEGVQAFDRADWPTVLQRFEAAEQLFHAPIHLKYMAIGYEHAGRMLDCARAWNRLANETLDPSAPQPFRDAVAEAQRELPRVMGRLGHLAVTIEGAVGATLRVDDRDVPQAEWPSVLVEPGSHTVTASSGSGAPVTRSVSVAAGATESVALRFESNAPPPPPPPPPPMTRTVLRPNPLRTVGIAVAGVGVATVLGGVITGVMASGAYSDLQTSCPNNLCPTQAALNERDRVDSLASTTNILLISGGVLAAAGVVLFAVATPRLETVRVSTTGTGMQLSVTF